MTPRFHGLLVAGYGYNYSTIVNSRKSPWQNKRGKIHVTFLFSRSTAAATVASFAITAATYVYFLRSEMNSAPNKAIFIRLTTVNF